MIESRIFSQFSLEETHLLKRLLSPQKIQDFLDTLPINFEEKGDTLMSPRRVLRERTAHCFEGAIFAAAALWFHGQKPLLLDLDTADGDENHVVALFREHGAWGAISKTNHAVLRYREPIYQTFRELVLSYFHEYTKDGIKTLRSYSRPLNLARFGRGWLTAEDDLWFINETFERAAHYPLLTKNMARALRRADPPEIKAGEIVEWW